MRQLATMTQLQPQTPTTPSAFSQQVVSPVLVAQMEPEPWSTTTPTAMASATADEVTGCTDAAACNYDATFTTDVDNTLCTFPVGCETCSGQIDGSGTLVSNDTDQDGICDADEVSGCNDASACNYNVLATDDDGSCEFSSCIGCTDSVACNYNVDATDDDGSCTYADAGLDCDGNCVNDSNNNGICDEDENDCPDYNQNGICDPLEVYGCTYSDACNYQLGATADNGSCTYPAYGFNCDGTTIDGSNQYAGCTYSEALNYSDVATVDDGSCVLPRDWPSRRVPV